MSEVRTRLERLGERIAPAPDALERLERARRRRERNRRIATAVVALLVAGGGSVGVLATIGRDDGRTLAAGEDAPDGIEITCDGSAVSMSTFAVAAGEAGVKIDVTNAGSTTMTFAIAPEGDFGDGVASDASAEAIDPGTQTSLRPLAPGRYEASCAFPGETETSGGSLAGPFEVVDPNGFYVDAVLGCTGSSYGLATASAAGDGSTPHGEHGSPLQVVGANLTGVEAGDQLQRAGYVASHSPLVRVVRDGIAVGLVRLLDDGSGGWLLDSLEGCGETAFGWDGPGGSTVEATPAPNAGLSGATGSTGSVDVATGTTGSGVGVATGSTGVAMACGDALAELHLVGSDLAFDLACLAAPAEEPLSFLFTNTDAGVPRNVAIYPMTECLATALGRDDVACSLEEPIFRGELIDGTGREIEVVYDVPPLAPGRYWFQDDVHPNTARGLLIVEPVER